jgi:hypothetical protein
MLTSLHVSNEIKLGHEYISYVFLPDEKCGVLVCVYILAREACMRTRD